MPLLEIKNLHGMLPEKKLPLLNGVEFSIEPGKISALVGESGSGKSLTALSILGLSGLQLQGEINFKNKNLIFNNEKDWPGFRGRKIAMVFQDAMMALNPTFSVANQIQAVLARRQLPKTEQKRKAIALLKSVGIEQAEIWIKAHPHKLSGGMRQRVLIAMALAAEPDLLIADEPTTALDVTVQAQILTLLKKFNKELGLTILFISHDLAVVAEIADQVNVMYGGRIVESGPTNKVLTFPAHPYTQALLRCSLHFNTDFDNLASIEGIVPAAGDFPPGCPFSNRCPQVEEACSQPVGSREVAEGHLVSCVLG